MKTRSRGRTHRDRRLYAHTIKDTIGHRRIYAHISTRRSETNRRMKEKKGKKGRGNVSILLMAASKKQMIVRSDREDREIRTAHQWLIGGRWQ